MHANSRERIENLVRQGPLKSLPSKNVTLTASLVDELGQPVVGRTVAFALGSQSISAVTNSTRKAAGPAALRVRR